MNKTIQVITILMLSGNAWTESEPVPEKPLVMTCAVERIVPVSNMVAMVDKDSNGNIISNTFKCVKMVVKHEISNVSSTNITFCVYEPELRSYWHAESIDMSRSGHGRGWGGGSVGRGGGGNGGLFLTRTMFRSLAPGESIPVGAPEEIIIPIIVSTVVCKASCDLWRDGHQIGLNAWTGMVETCKTFVLDLTNSTLISWSEKGKTNAVPGGP